MKVHEGSTFSFLVIPRCRRWPKNPRWRLANKRVFFWFWNIQIDRKTTLWDVCHMKITYWLILIKTLWGRPSSYLQYACLTSSNIAAIMTGHVASQNLKSNGIPYYSLMASNGYAVNFSYPPTLAPTFRSTWIQDGRQWTAEAQWNNAQQHQKLCPQSPHVPRTWSNTGLGIGEHRGHHACNTPTPPSHTWWPPPRCVSCAMPKTVKRSVPKYSESSNICSKRT